MSKDHKEVLTSYLVLNRVRMEKARLMNQLEFEQVARMQVAFDLD